ncbi:MAG TPA: cell division protein FtsK [Delftia acidovorans]|nr:cell division protein FtsK [Delftia acidovorans]
MAEHTDDIDAGGASFPPPPPPHATEESHASSALGAPAPLDNSVVHVDFQSGVRVPPGEAQAEPSRSSPPRPPKVSAAARDSGDGGGKAPADKADPPVQGKKKEKTVDWGKFNHLAENFVLIYGTDTVWDGAERLIMKIANMGHAHGADMVRMWKSSEKRKTVRLEDVVFDPTLKADPVTTVNLFDGMAMVPEAGDVTPMLELITYLTSRATPDEADTGDIMHWLLRWLAYPLQHPGAKLRTAVVMHGDEGAGKNFLFDIMVAIYGKYGALVGQDELEDKFNDWRSCKLFVVGDEVSSRAELVHNKNRLKALITSPTVQINPKNLTRREEKNHMNIAFLSNELQPLALDNSDRRYLVVYTPRAKDIEYYKKLGEWRDNGGVAAFYDYLLKYPLGDFHPYAPAPMTEAKSALIEINRKSPEIFWSEWQAGELDLPYNSCAVSQAYAAYLKWCQRSGDRYPEKQPRFTPMVVRFSEGQGCPARVKPMNVTRPGAAKKTERMFLVTDPIFGEGDQRMTEGEWATTAVRDFGDALRKYMGYGSGAPSPDGQEPEGGQ